MKTLFGTLFLATLATAQDPCCDPPKVPATTEAPDPCVNCAQLWSTCGPDWIITPNAGPCVANGADLALTADFIYWTVREDQLVFAVTDDATTGATTSASVERKISEPDWKMEPGFKVGLSFLFDYDGWNLFAEYTWLRPRTSRTVTTPEGTSFAPLGWIFPTSTDVTISSITGKWELDVNVVDLGLGRNFFISQQLHLCPHFGFKGAWNEQRYDFAATAVDMSQNPNVDIIGTGKHKLDVWGVGIRAGLDSSWHFTRCFSLYADVAATALWQGIASSGRSFSEEINSGLFNTYFNAKYNSHRVNPVLEAGLGLRWEDWFCCDQYHWWIQAGWELQWWSDQNKFLGKPDKTIHAGDLSLQGLTVSVRFDF